MIKFILFFLFVCFVVWGLMFATKELLKEPEQFAKVAKVIGISVVVVLVATVLIVGFVTLF